MVLLCLVIDVYMANYTKFYDIKEQIGLFCTHLSTYMHTHSLWPHMVLVINSKVQLKINFPFTKHKYDCKYGNMWLKDLDCQVFSQWFCYV